MGLGDRAVGHELVEHALNLEARGKSAVPADGSVFGLDREAAGGPAGSTEFRANAPMPSAVMMLMVAMSFFMTHTLATVC